MNMLKAICDWWNRYPREEAPCERCKEVRRTRVVSIHQYLRFTADTVKTHKLRLCEACEARTPNNSLV